MNGHVLVISRGDRRSLPANRHTEQTRFDLSCSWPIIDKEYIAGVTTRETLERAQVDGRKDQQLTSLLKSHHFAHVHADQALHIVLERMSKDHLDILPVVHRADLHKLQELVMMQDVLDSYGPTRPKMRIPTVPSEGVGYLPARNHNTMRKIQFERNSPEVDGPEDPLMRARGPA